MAHPHSHVQAIGEIPGDPGLTVWGYATRRGEADVLAPGYFQTFAPHLRTGDLLVVRHAGPPGPVPAPSLALFVIDRDARGAILVHEAWRLRLSDLRARAAAGADAADHADTADPGTAATADAASARMRTGRRTRA